MTEKLKKLGQYAEYETAEDEYNSKECVYEIYNELCRYKPINGWDYKVSKELLESLYYERDCIITPENKEYFNKYVKNHKVIPDLPTILLVERTNRKNFYVVLSGDDKFQKSKGNAVERSLKNHRAVFEEKFCFNSDICPYIIFCSGPAFIDKEGRYDDYLLAKWRQMLPYLNNGKPYIWGPEIPPSIFKKQWNLLYLQRDRFTKEQKIKIIREVAYKSVDYYKNILEK